MNLAKRCAAVSAALLLLAAAAQAQIQVYGVSLSGPNENPPNNSPGIGSGFITLNLQLHTLQVNFSFSGLTGTTTASHIHAPVTVPGGTAGVATQTPSFTGFPLGVTSGSMNMTFDMTLASTWNPSYITANGGTPAGAEAAFVSAVQSGAAYLNVHSSAFPGGEIRGFLLPVPEPATVGLFAVGAATLLFAARRKMRQS
jgi:hypothetical protein